MNKVLNILIKLILIQLILKQLFNFFISFANAFNSLRGLDYLQYILPFILSLLLFFIIWISTNKITEKIINKDNVDIPNINYKEILSLIIIAIGLYNIVFYISILINTIINLVMVQSKITDKIHLEYSNYFLEFNILECIILIILSVVLLVFRRKIIKIFEKI
jgi:hypothetical protein